MWLHSSTSHRTNLIFALSAANSLTKSCYLIKERAMGFDGILTSVFIPLEISPDANLMKKHRTAEIRRGRQRWGAWPFRREGAGLALLRWC